MSLKGGHKCVAPPFKVGDHIEAKEVIHRFFGPTKERWVPMTVQGIRHDNKMLLSIDDPSYPPSICVPYKEGWFRPKEKRDAGEDREGQRPRKGECPSGDQHQG